MTTISNYLDSINATPTVKGRVQKVVKHYSHLFEDEPPSHIFLSESIDGQGQKIYENLHLFYSNAWCEAHFFLLKEEYDVATLGSLTRALFISENFENPTEPSEESKLQIDISFTGTLRGKLSATGVNCQPLWKIGKDIFLPLLKSH